MDDAAKNSILSCTCGHPERKNINHRKRINCWAYIGSDRVDICPIEWTGELRETNPFDIQWETEDA